MSAEEIAARKREANKKADVTHIDAKAWWQHWQLHSSGQVAKQGDQDLCQGEQSSRQRGFRNRLKRLDGSGLLAIMMSRPEHSSSGKRKETMSHPMSLQAQMHLLADNTVMGRIHVLTFRELVDLADAAADAGRKELASALNDVIERRFAGEKV